MFQGIPWQPEQWKKLFFVIWSGQVFSLLGSRLVQFALVWWLTLQTGSGMVLATATIAATIPQVIVGPFVGALVDRWSRRSVMIVADSLIALSTVLLAALFATNLVQIWHIYAIMFARSVGGAFHWPAMQASTTLMVPKEHYSRIAGLNQTLQGVANIVSPPLGALLLSLLPMQWVLSVDVVTAALAVMPLLAILIPRPAQTAAQDARPSILREMIDGYRFMISWRGLLMVCGIAAFLNFLFAPAMALMPLLVTNHFQGEAYHLASLQTATGFGFIAGGLLLTAWGGFKRRMATSMFGIILVGAASILLGLAPSTAFFLAVVASFLTGLMLPVANGSLMAALQGSVPPRLQGRVFTLLSSATGAMMPLGLAIAGPLSDVFGAGLWFVVGGIAAIVLGIAAFFVPAIMHLEDEGAALGTKRQDQDGACSPEASPLPNDLPPAEETFS